MSSGGANEKAEGRGPRLLGRRLPPLDRRCREDRRRHPGVRMGGGGALTSRARSLYDPGGTARQFASGTSTGVAPGMRSWWRILIVCAKDIAPTQIFTS